MKALLNTLKSARRTSCILLALFSVNSALVAQELFVCNDLVSVSLGSNCMATVDPDQILEGGPYCCFQDYLVEIDNTPAGGSCNGPWIPAVFGLSDVGNTYCVRVRDPFHPSSQCFGLLHVVDIFGPTISCPTNQTRVTAPSQCDYTVAGVEFDPTAFNDNCPGATVAYKLISPINNSIIGTGATTMSGTSLQLGTTTVRWTVTDASTGTATCSFTVRIDDNQLPVITCPPNQVRIADANDIYTAIGTEFDPLTFFDNCPTYPVFCSVTGASGGSTEITLAGGIFNVGQTNVTWFLAELLNPNFVNSTCSFDVDVQSTRALLYLTNNNSNTVSALDPVTNTVTATIPAGLDPIDLLMGPDGSKVYVTNSGSNSVSVISTATNTVTATINVGSFPTALGLSPNGNRLYVCNANSNTVSVVNTATNAIIATVNVGTSPIFVQVKPDGSRIYIVNVNSGNISVINASTNAVMATIPLGNNFLYGGEAEMSPDGGRLYVTDYNSNNVFVINTLTNTLTATIPVSPSPNGAKVSPDNSRVYVPNYYTGQVSVINAATNAVVALIPVGANPIRLFLSPDGSRLYVSNSLSYDISVINTSTNTVAATISLGSRPFSMRLNQDGSRLFVIHPYDDNVSVINTADNTVLATTTVGDGPDKFSNFPAYATTTPCSITACPANRNVNLNGSCQLVVPDLTPELLIYGGCSNFTQTPAAGTLLPAFHNQVQSITLSVTGTASSCAVAITAKDVQTPVITCPGSKTRNTSLNQCGYTAIGSEFNPLSFSDNCAGSSITYNLSGATAGSGSSTLAGIAFNKGVTNISWTVTQAGASLSSTCAVFPLTVTDNQAPTISCISNQVRSTGATTCSYSAVGTEFNPAAFNDNCSGTTVSYKLSGVTTGVGPSLAGQVFNKGVTTVTWKATDAVNKTATCTFQVTVNDNQPPVFAICQPNPIVVPMGTTCKIIVPNIPTIVNDNCTAVVSTTQSPAANTLISVVHNQNVSVIITAKDASNNTSTCTRTLVASDQTKPTITTCPANRTVSLNGACKLVVPDMRSQLITTDCTLPVTSSQNPVQLAVLNSASSMQHLVTMTATDGAGNTKTCVVTLTAQLHAGCFTSGNPALERGSETSVITGENPDGNETFDLQVLPNPFNDQLTVSFHLQEATAAELVLIDISGRPVFHVNNETMEAGPQNIVWKTSDLAEGLYLVGLKKSGRTWIYRKVMLVR